MGLDNKGFQGGSVDFASQASAAEQAFRSGVKPSTGSLIHDIALTLDGTRMCAMLMQLTAVDCITNGFKNNSSSMTHQHRDKFNICKRARVRAHYAHIRARAMN